MKNVWILQTGEPLHVDEGDPRPMRAMNLASKLVEAGHSVVLWSSGFYHQKKAHRAKEYKVILVSEKLEVRLIPSPGYKKNIGFGRLWDHIVLANNLKKILKKEGIVPDVAFIGYPPIETAYVMGEWLKYKNVPFVMDIKDQWPSLFLDAFPKRARNIGRLILWPYFYFGKRALRSSTALSSMANGFLNWSIRFSGRDINKFDRVFPLTSPISRCTEEQITEAKFWWEKRYSGSLKNGLRILFVGSHTAVFDFETVKDAALYYAENNIEVEFVICGDGGCSAQVKAQFDGVKNAILPGWVDSAQIHYLASISDAAIIPYKNIDSFNDSLPNKVIDALALGLPILTPLVGELSTLVEKYNVGMRYEEGDCRDLVNCIDQLRKKPGLKEKISNNARELYAAQFSFDEVYDQFANYLVCLANNNKSICHG